MCGNQSVGVEGSSVPAYPAGLGGQWHVEWAEKSEFFPLSGGETTEMKKIFQWSLMNGYSLEKTKEVAHSILMKRREDYVTKSQAVAMKELRRLQSMG